MSIKVNKPPSLDAYIAALPEERQAAFQAISRTINVAAPGATEVTSYAMPALHDNLTVN